MLNSPYKYPIFQTLNIEKSILQELLKADMSQLAQVIYLLKTWKYISVKNIT